MGVPLPNGYAYLSGQQAGWTFSPPSPNVGYGFGGTGIAANGSAFNIYNAPGGTAAFLQGSTSVSQSFSLASTSDVSVAFLAQGRPYLAGPAPL